MSSDAGRNTSNRSDPRDRSALETLAGQRQRGDRGGRARCPCRSRHRLPRHAEHRDPRAPRRHRRPRTVGAEREGRPRGCARGGIRRGARTGDDEARRAQRRRRSALHRRVHGRHRRTRRGFRRRPGDGLEPERAGQPAVCAGRRPADAGAGRLAGGVRLHDRGLCDLRAMGTAGPPADHHAREPLEVDPPAGRGTAGSPGPVVRPRCPFPGDDPGPCAPGPPTPAGEARRDRGLGRDVRP